MTKRARYLSSILLLCGLLGAGLAAAEDRVLDVSPSSQPSVSLTEYFAVLEDRDRSLTLADVRQPDMARRFTSGNASGEALSYGYTSSAYWLRLHLRNATDDPIQRMLEVRSPLLSSVQFHQPMEGGYRLMATGGSAPFDTRVYPSRFFVFSLTVPARAEQVLYLRFESRRPMLIPARLWEPQAFYAHERGDYAAQTWYFGMATGLIAFNLLLFIALRDSAYLLYAAFSICMTLTIAAGNGLGKEYLWPETTWTAGMPHNVFGSLAFTLLMLFMRRLLSTRESAPRLDRLLKVLIGLQLLSPIEFLISLPMIFGAPISMIISSASQLLVLGGGLYCAFVKQQRMAQLFLLSYFVLMLGVVMDGLRLIGLLPTNVITMNGYQIGAALEMLLLAFALAYRFNLIRRQATEDVQRANVSLEQRLRDREAELTASHQRLREVERNQTLSQERQRLMQDMHDGLGSALSSALRVVEHGRLSEVDVAQVLKGCIDDLKLAIDSMEPVEADLLLLLAALRYRLQPRLVASGIVLRWEVQDLPPLTWLDPKNSLHILRILQEAFTNIIKHTNATEISVATATQGAWVLVTVADNGPGFSVNRALEGGGKGLSNQQRRAQAIGAEVTWDSTSAGTCLTLRLPIKRRSDWAPL